ncbi:MAG TPA: universal stress protein [Vicinamibacterales bacterium]|nr:universal stress protein [Vicinamibacterales bacterium]
MRLLLAIDDSAYSRAAVDAVIAQYRRDGTEVLVLNVIEWPAELSASLVFTPGEESAGPVMDLREDARRQSEELLGRAAEQLRAAGFSVSCEMREGDARHVILERAAEWRPDLIVVGSHGRTGLDRFLLGSVFENVVRHAPCSVAVVRGA